MRSDPRYKRRHQNGLQSPYLPGLIFFIFTRFAPTRSSPLAEAAQGGYLEGAFRRAHILFSLWYTRLTTTLNKSRYGGAGDGTTTRHSTCRPSHTWAREYIFWQGLHHIISGPRESLNEEDASIPRHTGPEGEPPMFSLPNLKLLCHKTSLIIYN